MTLAVIVVLIALVLYLKFRRSETFVTLATSQLAEPPKYSAASVDVPIVLFQHTSHRGKSWTLRQNQEQIVVTFDAIGNAIFNVGSLELQPGHKLILRMYDTSEPKKPLKEVVAKPRYGAIEDIDAYLREDSYLKYDHVFGYYPGSITNRFVTLAYDKL